MPQLSNKPDVTTAAATVAAAGIISLHMLLPAGLLLHCHNITANKHHNQNPMLRVATFAAATGIISLHMLLPAGPLLWEPFLTNPVWKAWRRYFR
jgi:hypothetical protein